MLHQERRNDLFPFANYGGHDFALQRQGLDGDIAYNINQQGQAARGGDARDRRMWMYTNPVTAVRAALDPATQLSNARMENGSWLVDLTLKSSDKLTLAVRTQDNLPEFVRWIAQVDERDQHYRIRFLSAPDAQWQSRSLQALRAFAPNLVTIEVPTA